MRTAPSGRCPDPDCHGKTEPEQDGDAVYDECTECGYATNWRRAEPAPDEAATCQAGIPEHVRRAAHVATSPSPLLQIRSRDALPQGR